MGAPLVLEPLAAPLSLPVPLIVVVPDPAPRLDPLDMVAPELVPLPDPEAPFDPDVPLLPVSNPPQAVAAGTASETRTA
jgi:hypothetical protein